MQLNLENKNKSVRPSYSPRWQPSVLPQAESITSTPWQVPETLQASLLPTPVTSVLAVPFITFTFAPSFWPSTPALPHHLGPLPLASPPQPPSFSPLFELPQSPGQRRCCVSALSRFLPHQSPQRQGPHVICAGHPARPCLAESKGSALGEWTHSIWGSPIRPPTVPTSQEPGPRPTTGCGTSPSEGTSFTKQATSKPMLFMSLNRTSTGRDGSKL